MHYTIHIDLRTPRWSSESAQLNPFHMKQNLDGRNNPNVTLVCSFPFPQGSTVTVHFAPSNLIEFQTKRQGLPV